MSDFHINVMKVVGILALAAGVSAIDRWGLELQLSPDIAKLLSLTVSNQSYSKIYFNNASYTKDQKIATWRVYNHSMTTMRVYYDNFINQRVIFVQDYDTALRMREQALTRLFYSDVTDSEARANYTQVASETGAQIMTTLLRYNTSYCIDNVPLFATQENMGFLGKQWVWDATLNLINMRNELKKINDIGGWMNFWCKSLGIAGCNP